VSKVVWIDVLPKEKSSNLPKVEFITIQLQYLLFLSDIHAEFDDLNEVASFGLW